MEILTPFRPTLFLPILVLARYQPQKKKKKNNDNTNQTVVAPVTQLVYESHVKASKVRSHFLGNTLRLSAASPQCDLTRSDEQATFQSPVAFRGGGAPEMEMARQCFRALRASL